MSFGPEAAGSCSGGESKDARNVAPPGAAFGPSWRQQWWDYTNHPAAPCRHGHLKAKNNKLVPLPTPLSTTHTYTHMHTHANECMFEYVYKGGGVRVGRGWVEELDEPATGAEWWHFCGISCLSLNICDTRLALEGMLVCARVCTCVRAHVYVWKRMVKSLTLETNEQVIKALSPFPPPLLTCQPTGPWETLGDTVPAHSNNKSCPLPPIQQQSLRTINYHSEIPPPYP